MKRQKLSVMLKGILPAKHLNHAPRAYDMVGDIIIFEKFPKELVSREKAIGASLLKSHNHIKVVCRKTRKYSGKFRLPKLKIMAGEKRKETLHKESGVSMKLDVEKTYFSPRLSSERLRIASLVNENESILVMFSGVGPYQLVLAKNTKAKEIYGIEANPTAYKYASENIKLNKISNVKLFLGDVRKIIPKLDKKFDRIIMPLPKGGEKFLKDAFKAAKKNAIIHLYCFAHQDEFKKSEEKVLRACKESNKHCKILKITKCGQYAPRSYRLCIDFKLI